MEKGNKYKPQYYWNMDIYDLTNVEEVQWPDLFFYYQDFQLMFFAEKRIIENAEEFIQRLEDELKLKVASDKMLQEKPIDEQEESYQAQYYEHFYGDAEKVINQVLQNQRKGSVLSIFSMIEGNLRVLCNLVQNKFSFKIKINDLNESDDLQKYWMYLSKVYEIDSTKLEPDYTRIKQQKYFRNKIAHNNSNIENKMIQSVRQTRGLKVNSYGDINELEITEVEYVKNLLLWGESFFGTLIELMEERCKILNNKAE